MKPPMDLDQQDVGPQTAPSGTWEAGAWSSLAHALMLTGVLFAVYLGRRLKRRLRNCQVCGTPRQKTCPSNVQEIIINLLRRQQKLMRALLRQARARKYATWNKRRLLLSPPSQLCGSGQDLAMDHNEGNAEAELTLDTGTVPTTSTSGTNHFYIQCRTQGLPNCVSSCDSMQVPSCSSIQPSWLPESI